MLTELSLGESSSFQICQMGRESCCFHVVVYSHECIFNKSKLGLDFFQLGSKVAVVVVVVVVAINLRDDGPVAEIAGGFVEGMEGRSGTSKEVVEPGGHGLGDLCIEVVRGEKEVNGVGLLVMVLACKEADTSIRAELDPLGIDVMPITDGNLGGDSPVVVLITNRSQGKLKLPTSLL
jgi:hypothetical protein